MRNKLEIENLIPQNLSKRIIDTLPIHFKTILLSCNEYDLIHIKRWIYFNTRDKTSITKCFIDDPKLGIDGRWCIGFENPVDLTFFSLGCPYFKSGK
jgi:hypothetical protein